MHRYINIFLLIISVLFWSLDASGQHKLTVEAPSKDVTLTVRGPERVINAVNPGQEKLQEDGLILITSRENNEIFLDKNHQVALCLDANLLVVNVVDDTSGGSNVSIPQLGAILIATERGSGTKGCMKFLTDNFAVGDVVKLRLDDEVKSLGELVISTDVPVYAKIDVDFLSTVTSSMFDISGKLINTRQQCKYDLIVQGGGDNATLYNSTVDLSGHFSATVNLQKGVNYLNLFIQENGKTIERKPFIVFYKNTKNVNRDVIMWVEQFPNLKTLLTEKDIENMILKSKSTGVTAFGVDVKGPEGYVSYRKNELSQSPYYTAIKNPNKQTKPKVYDFLASFVKLSHKHGMKVYASFNMFTEGNVGVDDYAVLQQHPDWEEIVQRPEDKGKLLPNSQTIAADEARQGKRVILGFVNPSNKEVQDFQLARVREVLMNYDVDGIVMDRCRYDNLYADFSNDTKSQFETYLQQQHKKLENFPADAFVIDENGKRIDGKYFKEWITFRSGVIKQFADRLRALVDEFKQTKNPDLQLAAYVGSWFESYWQNGVNWSSLNFRYNNQLGFPESYLYTPEYYQTSYLHDLDFLMIGTYYKTEREINRYITIGNILTNGELPLVAGVSLPDIKEQDQPEVFEACLQYSNGIMLFDLCYVNWAIFTPNMLGAIDKLEQTK